MRRNPINYNRIYFLNEAHQENFRKCIQKFACRTNEYTSTCYLAAYPEIFKCFDLERQENGPFDWYFDSLDNVSLQEHRSTGSTAPLTGQTTALVNLALNLWNGKEFDLASGLSIWDSELYAVALQAINLRQQGRSIIDE
ncbi:DUF6075 family protein [Paenibacillus crassostreae]|uniref:Uncharacterized protein n=1 Tax=Paenibacillus crassostreae TaxID=1763538 RepID=A0A167AGU1_9BACL|nr:DUF6075 family protein [Paenibacillus crassostreae]AOZ92290.1 hypothetical protein LPB68_08660 [Paenibacillus crassostreae]OAB71007.1 hypothetical protein PNBC_20810 [Paenibacillus crassostreae]